MSNETITAGTATPWAGEDLRVSSDRLILDGQLPDLGVLNRYRNVVIWADTVEIRDCCRFIGQNVTIMARRLTAQKATLDVSGAKVADMPDDPTLDAVVDLRQQSPNSVNESFHGKDGRDAPNGYDGGSLFVYVGEFAGDMTLRADGSDGGRGQRGGAGGSWPRDVKPQADYAAHDGVLAPGAMPEPETAKYGFKWLTHPAGPNAWFKDRHHLGAERWVVINGWSGPKGYSGGRAGRPGRSGRGGNGGNVRLYFQTKVADSVSVHSAARGRGGHRQWNAHGGMGTVAHDASLNALYCFFEKGGAFREGPFHLGGQEAKLFSELRVSNRAGSLPGPMGEVPGDYAEGAAGADGQTELSELGFGSLSTLLGREFIQHLMDQAAESAKFGAADSARERYLWLQELTRKNMPDLCQQIGVQLQALVRRQ